MSEQKYATYTGDQFLFFELKEVLKLKKENLEDRLIREKVKSENLFQYTSAASIARVLPPVIKRANLLDEKLIDMVLEEDTQTGKLINLYAMMKSNRLFFEFMDEVVREKYKYGQLYLEKKDINEFFDRKIEQSEEIASWSHSSIQKMKQVTIKSLYECGMVENIRSGDMNRINIQLSLKRHLVEIGDEKYLIAMGVSDI
ncbi:MAG: DUF1819 family protein [Terrisporobacter sp.]|uniref:DUF1819 family protein n=1 Tax=Terrisporobacter sp. TaxID=1965305 RepID=UPI002FCBEC82